jgi:hypothetical protein
MTTLFISAVGLALIIVPAVITKDDRFYWLMSIITLPIVGVAIFKSLSAWMSRLILYSDRFVYNSVFKRREYSIAEIQGYRIGLDEERTIVLKDRSVKPIKLSNNFEKKEEISAWFSKNLMIVPLEESQPDEKQIINENDLGLSENERKEKLERIQKLNKWIHYVFVPVMIWGIASPYPYKTMCTVCILCPWIGIGLLYYYKGVFILDGWLDGWKVGTRPNAVVFFAAPASILVWRALKDWNILSETNIWLPTIMLTCITFTALLLFAKEQTRDVSTRIMFFFMLSIYSYGVIVTSNGAFDTSIPKKHQTKILKKEIQGGRIKTYTFTLAPWGVHHKNITVDVQKTSVGWRQPVGYTVEIYEYEGAFSIPWFLVK